MKRNNPFIPIFVFAALALILLPFITTFNSLLTNLLLKFHYYKILQDWVVPYQAKMISSIVAFLPIKVSIYPVATGFWLNGGFVELQWNCLGWQSLVLLVFTFITGMQGKFTKISRLETVFLGILGTYLMNVIRIVIVILLSIFLGRTASILFHDYFSLLFTIAWFFVFWWFSYNYVLEEQNTSQVGQD